MSASVGENGSGLGHAPPAPLWSTVKLELGLAAALPDHGLSELVVLAGPHRSGLASGAAGPPLIVSLRSEKGTWGWFLNVFVTWPVDFFAVTVPSSFCVTPCPVAYRYR